MTAKRKQQLFLGTVVLEVIMIAAIGWVLFAPLAGPREMPPVTPPVVDEPPADPQPGTAVLLPPGPVLTPMAVKAAIAHSIVGICSNNIGFPPCLCATSGTPPTFHSGSPLHCLIPTTHRIGPVMYGFVALSSHHRVSGFSLSPPPSGGCLTCGGSSGPQGSVPELDWWWQTDFRSLSEPASLGPGLFTNYDARLHLYADDAGVPVLDLFDPQDLAVRRMRNTWSVEEHGEHGGHGDSSLTGMFAIPESWFADERYRTVRGVQLEDAAGNPVATPDLAARATLRTHEGTQFRFEFFALPDAVPPPDPHDPHGGGGTSGVPTLEGRLTGILDRTGRGVTISYKSWTAEQIEESPERQWQIDQVTDATGRTAVFSYAAEQVSGQWAVQQVSLPDGQTIAYEYTDGKLAAATQGGETLASYAYSTDSTAQTTVVQIADGSGGGPREFHLTSNFYGKEIVDMYQDPMWLDWGREAFLVYNQASLVTRLGINGAGEVEYFNYPRDSHSTWIYEGGGKLLYADGYKSNRYYGQWEFNPPTDETVVAGLGHIGTVMEGSRGRLRAPTRTVSVTRRASTRYGTKRDARGRMRSTRRTCPRESRIRTRRRSIMPITQTTK